MDSAQSVSPNSLCIHCKQREPRARFKSCQVCSDEARKKRRAINAKGVCVSCRVNRHRPNRTLCQECAERKNAPLPKVKGICHLCNKNEPREGLVTCQDCADRHKAIVEKRKKQGICVKCPNPVVRGFTRCVTCREKQRALNVFFDEEVVLSGKCQVHPDRDVSEKCRRFCKECTDKRAVVAKAKRAAKKATKICYSCKKKVVSGNYCETHRAANTELRNLRAKLRKIRNTVSDSGNEYGQYLPNANCGERRAKEEDDGE